MGLSCAVQLGNIYLEGLDEFVVRTFSANLHFYRRFVDDILIIGIIDDVADFLERINSWHPSIRCTHVISKERITFLDLDISQGRNGFEYCTFRKPQCQYLYCPAISNHSHAVRCALILGELTRLLVTNSSEAAFNFEVARFRGHLVQKGYSDKDFRACLTRRNWLHRHQHIAKIPPACEQFTAPFIIDYWIGAEALHISSIMRKSLFLLPEMQRARCRIVTCFTSAANLFRRRFRRFVEFESMKNLCM